MDCQKNTKENIVFRIKLLVPIEVLTSVVLHYITRPLYLRACMRSCDQQWVQQYVPKRHNNTIRKLFLRSKTIKATLSSITRIGPIIYMEDPKEALGVDHAYIEEDTEVEKTTIADIATTIYLVGSDTTSAINLDAS